MKIKFFIGENELCIIDIENKSVKNIEVNKDIDNGLMIIFPDNITYNNLELLFRYWYNQEDSKNTLEYYLEDIKKNGFKSQYEPSLSIKEEG